MTTPIKILKKQLQEGRQYIQLSTDTSLAYYCWNPRDTHKPAALLIHGTGFVAATFYPLAQFLTPHFQVFAYDRRGHGHSSKPNDAYHLIDFANDCHGFCQALELTTVFAVGHSAGGTDVLVAEALNPGLFKKMFVMEPTVRDPEQNPLTINQEEIINIIQTRLAQARKRRNEFDNSMQVESLYRDKPLFNGWTTDALRAYIADGFSTTPNDNIELQCHPNVETKILECIYLTFQNIYQGDNRGDPFANLANIQCPIAVSCSEHSGPQFRELAHRMKKLLPKSNHIEFKGVGHCVPQEDPSALAKQLLNFWRT